jgi:hypothetical protein
MPSGYMHKKISKFFLGKTCEKTNKIIDYPVRFLGKKHRVLFHDPLSAMAIGYFTNGSDGVYSGLLHLAVDRICSEYKIVKKLLDLL